MKGTDATPSLRVGLAAARNAPAVEERLETVERFLEEAGAQGVTIVCFPEAYLPGLRGEDFPVPPPDQRRQQAALDRVRAAARRHGVAVVMGMEWETAGGLLNAAFVIGRDGEIQGCQAKNQLAPQEEPFYVPDGRRRLFEVDGVPFGVAICHEGWRYPETVRWAARRGAHVVFHPHFHAAEPGAYRPTTFADPANTFHEKALLCRAAENTCYVASVNYASPSSPTTSAVVRPDGTLQCHQPYGVEGLLMADINPAEATGLLASRYKPAE